MKQFEGACGCECTPTKKSSECGPKSSGREDLASGQCCGGELDDCCTDEEADPDTRPGLWARYIERVKKATGGQSPKCH